MKEIKLELAKMCDTCKYAYFAQRGFWKNEKVNGVCVLNCTTVEPPEYPDKIYSYIPISLADLQKDHMPLPTKEVFMEECNNFSQHSVYLEKCSKYYDDFMNYYNYWNENKDKTLIIHKQTVCQFWEEKDRQTHIKKYCTEGE